MATKKLPSNMLKANYEQFHRIWFVQLQPGYEFGDLFAPGFWSHHNNLKKTDLIRVRAHDGSFDCFVTVLAAPQGGAVVDVWPRYLSGNDAAAAREAAEAATAARPKVVPIMSNGKVSVRVDFREATQWRVIALDGSTLSEGHATQADAETARDKYLKELGMELPSAEAIAAAEDKAAKADAERKAAGKARGRAA
jgi:hypothetical protein